MNIFISCTALIEHSFGFGIWPLILFLNVSAFSLYFIFSALHVYQESNHYYRQDSSSFSNSNVHHSMKRSSQLVHLIDLSLVFMMTSGSSCCAAIIVDIAHSRTHCYSAMPQHFKCKFLDHHNSFNKQNWGGQLYNVDQSLLFQKFGIYKIFQLSDSDECSKLFIVSFCLRASWFLSNDIRQGGRKTRRVVTQIVNLSWLIW